jgi:hypothetical protein
MINDKQMLELFARFQSVRRETAEQLSKTRILRPDNYELPSRVRSFATLIFFQMATDFTPNLLGEVNRFFIGIHHAESWFKVAQSLEEDDRASLLWEFADPHFELAVGCPYSLRNQFVFAAVHLLHQSNKLRMKDWKDNLPPDEDINYKHLEKLGAGWPAFPQFMERIECLNENAFKKATGNFRHKGQHRYKLRFDRGLTPVFERIKTENGITYSYGCFRPLDIEQLIPQLYTQHQQAMDTFLAYWQLVNELCAEWDKQVVPTEGIRFSL